MRLRALRGGRRSALVLVLAMLVIAGTALAYWQASGSGAGSGAVGSLNAPTAVGATPGTGTAHVSWTASSTAGGRPAPTGYYVRRWSGALPTTAAGNCGTPASPVNQTSCDDAGIADGTYTYTVVAVYHSWTAESTQSSSVTVTNDVTAPTSSITFPTSGSRHNATGWGAGCSPAGICGSASDSGAGATGVSQVQANIQRASDSRYWNVSTSTWVVGLVWNTASGTTSWNLALPASNLDTGVAYTVQSRAIDGASNTQSPVASSSFTYDTTAPTVTNVTSTLANGSYKDGQVVPVTVTFSEAVTVAGTPQLTLALSPNRAVNYSAGSGTNTLTFNYTVAPGDTSADLDYAATSSLALNGGTIRDAAANDATLTLASPGASGSLGANKAIVIDTTAPAITITRVNGTTQTFPYFTNVNLASIGGACGTAAGDSSTISVTVNGSATSPATTTCSAGSWTLTFSSAISASNTYNFVASQSDTTTNTGTAAQTVTLDKTVPTVTGVSSTLANGSYKAGQVVPVTVTFSEAVAVTGTPQLTLALSPNRAVNYSSGSGTNTLTFNYTVAPGDTSADLDYAATTSLALNGGTIRDAAANNATLTLASPGASGSLGANKAIVIDTTAPAVTITRVNGTTQTFPYFMNANLTSIGGACTTVDGPVSVAINGSATSPATAGCSSGSWTLTFSPAISTESTYTFVASQSDTATNTGTATQTVTLDKTAPTVTNVTSTLADGTYDAGQVVPVTVTFSEAVTVTGTPQLTLAVSPNRAVNYSSGSGTNTLTFNYTVGAGDDSADLDYAATSSLALNGGTIRDATANNATLTLASPGASGSLGANKNIVVDGTAPTITAITSQQSGGGAGNGKLEVGDILTLTISEPLAALPSTFSGASETRGGTNQNVKLTIPNVVAQSDAGSKDYFSGNSARSATFSGTLALVNNGASTTVTITVTSVTTTDTLAPSNGVLALMPGTALVDLAGNNASATFSTPSSFKLF